MKIISQNSRGNWKALIKVPVKVISDKNGNFQALLYLLDHSIGSGCAESLPLLDQIRRKRQKGRFPDCQDQQGAWVTVARWCPICLQVWLTCLGSATPTSGFSPFYHFASILYLNYFWFFFSPALCNNFKPRDTEAFWLGHNPCCM